MTGRDRIVIMVVVVAVVLAGGWLLAVSPERKRDAEARAQVQSAHQQLEAAQTKAASARSAQRRYAAAYSSVVGLGKAVPPSDEVPALIYELDLASDQRGVNFNSITSGSTTGSSATASASAAASAAEPTSFAPMPFTFVFKGSFARLAQLLGTVEGFDTRTNTGGLTVNGRLLTIQGAEIALESGGGETIQGSSPSTTLSATITATAYVLPAPQGLTGGATPLGPSGASSASAGSGGSGSSLAATPAVVKVAP
ncbi:MAG TPA: type II secretion system protein GspM [Solirubrobacteraceae bacterium]|jgi:multidrug efflux pump subunit AcrA (membrane-fusion protein)|nr:type II secretion system protein GspM [Solirubrobacteraceae bacterium]